MLQWIKKRNCFFLGIYFSVFLKKSVCSKLIFIFLLFYLIIIIVLCNKNVFEDLKIFYYKPNFLSVFKWKKKTTVFWNNVFCKQIKKVWVKRLYFDIGRHNSYIYLKMVILRHFGVNSAVKLFFIFDLSYSRNIQWISKWFNIPCSVPKNNTYYF